MSGTDAPENGVTIGECTDRLGSITFNSASTATWQVENALYSSEVVDNYHASNGKALKAGSDYLYIKIELKDGAKFKTGDRVNVCGYNSWIISSSADDSKRGDISAALETGTDKDNYKVGSVRIPVGIETSTIYLSRANSSSTGVASIDITRVTGNVVGPDAKNISWTGKTADAYSAAYELAKNTEYKFEFDVDNDGKTDPWFSWVIMASESESNLNPGDDYFSLRPDNYVYERWSGNSLNTLALVGGALDWETFKRDINGAHVTAKVSFDGTNMFVYQVIENNGRTYTYYYPYTLSSAKDKVYLRVGVDQSQLTHFAASVVGALKLYTYVRNISEEVKPEMGSIVMTNQQGVTILEGSTVGRGTIVRLTATANSGYVFDHWSNGSKEYYREFEVGSNRDTEAHNFSAYFKSLADFETNWTLKNTSGQLYDSKGTAWFGSGPCNSSTFTNEWDGAYDASGNELATTKGLLFNNNVRLNNYILLQAPYGEISKGAIKIPVVAGEVVTINAKGSRTVGLKLENAGVSDISTSTTANNYSFVAVTTGYITVSLADYTDGRTVSINSISKTAVRDFTFADGTSVPAQPGCVGYINAPKGTTELQQQIVDLSTFTWTSSNPADVSVDPSTGAIIINNSFNGSVQITATMNEVKENGTVTLPAVAKSYTLTTSTNTMKFANEAVNVILDESSIATYWQSVTWTDPNNIPEGDINYTVVSTTAKKAEVTSDDNGDGSWNVTIFGKGVTVIKATCGALSATYKITSAGFVFDNNGVDVYDFAGYYQQAISGATYTIAHKYGAIASTNIGVNSDGSLTNLPSYDDNKGGAIVVEATANVNGETKKASYVLTIPYKKYVWNFYKQGLTGDNYNQVLAQTTDGADGNKYHFVFGDLLQNVRCPGSAPEQPATGTIPNDGSGEFPGQYAIDAIINDAINVGQKTNLQKMLQWRTDQDLESVKNDANDPHNYFNYTYKTLEHQYKNSKKPISYSNEALFSYVNAVNGNNARIISDTQGLVFSCSANKFGINDNHTGTVQDYTEQDRAVLLRGYSSFTVPHVTEGHYIKIHWYRHAPNAGDQFYVTNAKDLDGKTINPKDKLRFTSAHYTHHNWEGSLILQAASTGDVTITIANANWTELYRIEVTDTYESDMKLAETHIWKPEGGTPYGGTKTAFERDINDPSIYNRTRLDDSSGDFGESVVQKLVSRVQTHAKGGALIESPAELYFTGYAAQNNTWNGWMNNNVQVVFEGTASCDVRNDDENGISNILPTEYIRVGAALDYPMFPLRNIKGVGTIKLIARTITGFDGEPHYTLNKQVAYVPVGEYSVQEYPYTWDFTKYNTGKKNAYSTSGSDYKTIDKYATSQNAANHYGSYADDLKMAANAAQDVNSGYAYIEGHKAPVSAQRNKRFFAQGAQLALGDGDCHTILEAEGLRINLNAVNDANNGAVYFTKNGDETTLVVNGTITVPEVDKGMYVFVRSAAKPTSVTGATEVTSNVIKNEVVNYQGGFDNGASVTLKQADIPENVWVYLQETEGLNDVVITPAGAVEGIGVTKYFKKMVQFENTDRASYTTDSRHERIDYQNTGFFTKHDLKAYIASDPDLDLDAENQMDRENGTTAIQEVTVVPSSTEDQTSRRGILLCDNVEESTCTARPLLPLFVPACNIVNDNISSNRLIAAIGCDKNGVDDGSCAVTAATETTFNYVITNSYYNWDWTEKKKKEVAGAIDSFLQNISFVILREAGNVRPNSAYLSITVPEFKPKNEVKQLYLYVGERLEEDATTISNVYAADAIESAEPAEVYTITGVKLQGIPAKKGVYVVNGKKVFIK